jgi:hypothetical protein
MNPILTKQSEYKLYIEYTAGTLFELPYISFNFSEELNVGINASINLDYETIREIAETYNTSPAFLLSAGVREIYIEKNGTKIYYGVISEYGQSEDDKGKVSITIASVGFFTLLNKRIVTAITYTNDDAGDIAWDLINTSQLADPPYTDLGITRGTHPATKNRDRTYDYEKIGEKIFQLSNNNLQQGFDFDIDNTKKFNIYYPQKGSEITTVQFDDSNIVEYTYQKPLVLSLTNKVYVLGEAIDNSPINTTRISASAYKTAFGTLESVLKQNSISEAISLEDAGDKYLADNQSPIEKLSISHSDDTPDILAYNMGDSVRVTILNLELNRVLKRIYKRKVDVDVNGECKITLTLK